QALTDVAALTSIKDALIIVKTNGTVFKLTGDPFQYDSIDPVSVGGEILSNIIAVAGNGPVVALKKDGTVVAFGDGADQAMFQLAGLSNIIAITAFRNQGLVLKRDSTVAAWGENNFGQSSVPAGLSNVIAIASKSCSFAITTGNIPASVYIPPHGTLEQWERKADLVFKGQVISDRPVGTTAFPDWAKAYVAELKITSVINGEPISNVVTFLHMTAGPGNWGGSRPPEGFLLTPGNSYVIFADRADRDGRLYSAPTNPPPKSNEFRQTSDAPLRTLDSRPCPTNISIKEIYWLELNRLLADRHPTNQLYAIEQLDRASHRELPAYNDFKRQRVLTAQLPLISSRDEQVAIHSLNSFNTISNPAIQLAPFTNDLVRIANKGITEGIRMAAIDASSGLNSEALSNSLAKLSRSKNVNLRVACVRLLPRFASQFSRQKLQELANDGSPDVRSVVADVIGDQKDDTLL